MENSKSAVGAGAVGIAAMSLYKIINLAQAHAARGADSILRYTTRFGIYRIQLFKTLLISTLLLIFITQIFHSLGSSSSSDQAHKDLLVIKPEDVYNSHYDSLVDLQNLEHLGLNQRCNTFFEKLSSSQDFKDFDWFNSNLKDVKIVPKLKTFLEQKKLDNKQDKYSNDQLKEWEKEYNQNFSNDKIYMKRLLDFISNLRIYGTCYIENNLFNEITGAKKAYNLFWDDEAKKDLTNSNTFQISNELEIRLFPWITKIYPVFKHGLKQLSVGLPQISNDADNDDQDFNSKSSFLYNYKHGLNGKGIVIPVYDSSDIKYLFKISKVLRFSGNKLPIQIVHKGLIDEDDEKKIYEAFTKDIDGDEIFHTDIIDSLPNEYDTTLSKQDIYFVDIKMSITDTYSKSIMNRVKFKNFAILFNLRYSTPAKLNEVEFFTDLLPNKVDSHFFGIEQVSSDFIKSSRFFHKNFAQLVNNDVVVLNKRDNFLGVLLSLSISHLPLKFETPFIENEFVWLGSLLSGEKVYFHDTPTSLIGTFTDDSNRRIKLSASKEICSSHKGVFDNDNSTLIFITNGAFNCDEDNIELEKEVDKPFFRGFQGKVESLKKWQLEKTTFKAAIIPVAQEFQVPNKIDEVAVSISNEEHYCNNQMLCVYDILGARDDAQYHGQVIEIDSNQHQVVEYIEKLWS
ncbi:unnamed protein product [Wickerhamomyces anomalus]